MGLLTINHGVYDTQDHARAMFGPCWGHVCPSFISTLIRAVEDFSMGLLTIYHGVYDS